MNRYEDKALGYAETYGICSYKVQGSKMVYYTSYPCTSHLEDRATYKCTVDLEIMDEVREEMSRYYKPYKHIGKCQVLYMA